MKHLRQPLKRTISSYRSLPARTKQSQGELVTANATVEAPKNLAQDLQQAKDDYATAADAFNVSQNELTAANATIDAQKDLAEECQSLRTDIAQKIEEPEEVTQEVSELKEQFQDSLRKTMKIDYMLKELQAESNPPLSHSKEQFVGRRSRLETEQAGQTMLAGQEE